MPPEGEQKEAQYRTADPDYLKVAGARLLRGRFFDKPMTSGIRWSPS